MKSRALKMVGVFFFSLFLSPILPLADAAVVKPSTSLSSKVSSTTISSCTSKGNFENDSVLVGSFASTSPSSCTMTATCKNSTTTDVFGRVMTCDTSLTYKVSSGSTATHFCALAQEAQSNATPIHLYGTLESCAGSPNTIKPSTAKMKADEIPSYDGTSDELVKGDPAELGGAQVIYYSTNAQGTGYYGDTCYATVVFSSIDGTEQSSDHLAAVQFVTVASGGKTLTASVPSIKTMCETLLGALESGATITVGGTVGQSGNPAAIIETTDVSLE